MNYQAGFRTVFPAKKGTKRHSKQLAYVSMSYLGHLDGIPKKLPFSRQFPFKYPYPGYLGYLTLFITGSHNCDLKTDRDVWSFLPTA